MKSQPVRKNLKKLLLLVSISLFVLSLFQLAQYWDYQETLVDLDKSIRKTIKKESLIQEIRISIAASEFDDARMFLAIAKSSKLFNSTSNNTITDLNNFALEIKQKDTVVRQVVTQATHFTNGFIRGKGADIAGVTGSIVADFTVIGDARDLSREYGNYQKGESVNELIVLLSGAGIGLTALTISTRGVAAPAKAGASIMKVAAKTQRVTLSFQKHLLKLGRQVFDWPIFIRAIKNNKSLFNIRRAATQAYHPDAIQPLKKIAKQVNTIRKSTSTVDTVHLFKYIDSPKDLIQLEKVSLKYGIKTKGMMKLLGKGALRTVRVLHKTTKLLLSILSSLLSGVFSLFLLFTRKSLG